jgi:hypothetical protein
VHQPHTNNFIFEIAEERVRSLDALSPLMLTVQDLLEVAGYTQVPDAICKVLGKSRQGNSSEANPLLSRYISRRPQTCGVAQSVSETKTGPESAPVPKGSLTRRLSGPHPARQTPNVKAMTDGTYRLRVGDWRAVYALRDDVLMILVLRVGHRRAVYR